MMNRGKIYIALLVLFCFGIILYSGYQDKDRDFMTNRGMNYIAQDKEQFLQRLQGGTVFSIYYPETKRNEIYRLDAYEGNSNYRLLTYALENQEFMELSYLMLSLANDLEYKDTVRLALNELQELVLKAPEFEAAKELVYDSADGFFDYIDNSIFVIFFMAFIFLVMLLLIELGILLARWLKIRHPRMIVYISALLFALLFMTNLVSPPSLPLNRAEQFYRPVLLLLPVFIFFQYSRRTWISKFAKADAEAIKFIIIVLGVGFMSLISTQISKSLSPDDYPFIQLFPNSFDWGFAFSFAIGNLIFNQIKNAWSNRQAKKQLMEAEKQVLNSESELASLQSSVNPHFLYNSLNSIAALSTRDPEKTRKMAFALSDFYRYNTNRNGDPFSTLGEEIEMLKTYLEIEKIRFEDKLNYSINVGENLKDERIPHFLLQPLVENAVKYGYNKSKNQTTIQIDVRMEGQKLKIEIGDNGEDFKEDMQKGFGLKSVTKKLKLLYPGRHEMEFINQPSKKVLISLIS